MRKKNVMKWRCAMTSFDFSFFPFYFLVVQKVEFSHPVQYSTSPKYPCFPELLVLDLHRLHDLMGRTLSLLRLECSREEERLVRAKNFSARNPQLFSFSSLLTEVPKNRSQPRLIQEYFFLSLLLPMTRVNPIELFFCGQFRLLLIEQKSLRQPRLPDGTICIRRCRRVGNSGEKVWLW